MIIADHVGQPHPNTCQNAGGGGKFCRQTAPGGAGDIFPTEAEPEKTLYDQAQ
ncbi:MAG: hypothetical protein MUC60_09210 [Oscillatoria sp. Prado101]|jgi:hypothetical protein|nr:hypothetical protein [Oscillatoria sp. Prado101]